MIFILSVLAIFCVLVATEWWWRRRGKHGEFSRKFVHLTVGSFVAFWPFFLSWRQIQLLSIGFIIVIAISKWLGIFTSIHSVQRPTWGEIYFALVVGAATLLTHDKWIYAVSLLQMSLADGLAAVIGVRYGRRQRYYVFGHTKSVAGTLTFFVTSCLLLMVYSCHAQHLSPPVLGAVALAATVIENLAVTGLDNIFVPLLCIVILRMV